MSEIFIHPSAIVSENADIGKGTKIWVNSQVRENATIGQNCIISKDTYIDHNVKIGNGVKIQNGVSVYNGVTIEDDVFVGPNVTFTNDLYPRATNSSWKVTDTIVKTGSSIGANSTIVCGNTLGRYSMIGAGSVVTRDIPDYALALGNPARIVGYVCSCGFKLDKNNKCSKCNSTILIGT